MASRNTRAMAQNFTRKQSEDTVFQRYTAGPTSLITSSMNKTELGKKGEQIAKIFLEGKGYKIVELNFKIRGGEIDIVAIDGQTLVYVEVKTRTTFEFGRPEESVTRQKIKFLVRAAKFYRNSRRNLPDLERIDVISIDLSNPQKVLAKHIKNASF